MPILVDPSQACAEISRPVASSVTPCDSFDSGTSTETAFVLVFIR